MKKICFILALILILCGCSSAEPEGFSALDVPSIIPGSGFQSEPAKIFLPLENLREKDSQFPDFADIFGTRTEIPAVLPENFSESDSNVFPATLWPELVAEIQKDVPDFDPENPGWKANYNFFAKDETTGMLKINYYIADNIITDKAIIGTVENGVIVRLNYTNTIFETDEEKIREKAENFLENTAQAKKIFEEGEEFLSEETMFHYHYSLDTLMYCYQLYFTYEHDGRKIINNDWGHECIVK